MNGYGTRMQCPDSIPTNLNADLGLVGADEGVVVRVTFRFVARTLNGVDGATLPRLLLVPPPKRARSAVGSPARSCSS